MPLASLTHRPGARVVKRVQRIGAAVELYVDPAHFMLCGPLDGIFELEPPPDINSDPIAQTHQLSPVIAVRCMGRPGSGYTGFSGGNASSGSRPSSKKPML